MKVPVIQLARYRVIANKLDALKEKIQLISTHSIEIF